MKYDIVRVTIASGDDAPSAYEVRDNGAWVPLATKYPGHADAIALDQVAGMSVQFPAAIDGEELRFKAIYEAGVTGLWCEDDAGDAILVAAAVDKDRTVPPDIFTRRFVQPYLTNASGVAQAQGQDTYLIFTLKRT